MKDYLANEVRNVTVLGHSGAGKSSLIEACLFKTKAIDKVGKNNDGTTALNFDDGFLKPSSEQRLMFRDFSMMYDEHEALADIGTVPIKDIYYNHEFTQSQVQDIIMALRTSGFIDVKNAEKLIDKYGFSGIDKLKEKMIQVPAIYWILLLIIVLLLIDRKLKKKGKKKHENP